MIKFGKRRCSQFSRFKNRCSDGGDRWCQSQRSGDSHLQNLSIGMTLTPPISAVRAPIFKPRKLRTSPLPELYHAYHFWGFMVLLEHASIRSMSLQISPNQLCLCYSANSRGLSSSVGPKKSIRSVKSIYLDQLKKNYLFIGHLTAEISSPQQPRSQGGGSLISPETH